MMTFNQLMAKIYAHAEQKKLRIIKIKETCDFRKPLRRYQIEYEDTTGNKTTQTIDLRS